MSFIKTVITSIFDFFYEIFFGCRHESLTRPFTLNNRTYKVCLDCGHQVFYSPVTMRPLTHREIRRMHAAQGAEVSLLSPVAGGQPLMSAAKQKSAA